MSKESCYYKDSKTNKQKQLLGMVLIKLKERIVIGRKVTFPIKMSYSGKSWKALFLIAWQITNINDYHRLTVA